MGQIERLTPKQSNRQGIVVANRVNGATVHKQTYGGVTVGNIGWRVDDDGIKSIRLNNSGEALNHRR